MIPPSLRVSALAVLVSLSCPLAFPQSGTGPALQFPAASPGSTLKQRVGLTDFEIVYSRPSVKEREIFGGLVPYGEVWRTGANSATRIAFNTAVKLNGVEFPAGTYGLFTIPGKDEWTIILNQDEAQWGAYQYNAAKDVARVKATPVALANSVETFAIGFDDLRNESATLYLEWEKTRVPVKVEVAIVAQVLSQIESTMAAEGKKSAGLYYGCAQFYFDHGQDMNKALDWVNRAVAMSPEAHYMVHLQARILAKQGKKKEAIAAANRSIELAKAAKDPGFVKLNGDLIESLR